MRRFFIRGFISAVGGKSKAGGIPWTCASGICSQNLRGPWITGSDGDDDGGGSDDTSNRSGILPLAQGLPPPAWPRRRNPARSCGTDSLMIHLLRTSVKE